MRRMLTLLMVLTLLVGASGGLALAQDDGPSPDSPTKDRDDDGAPDAEDEPGPDGDDATPAPDDSPLPEAPAGPLDLAAMTLDSNVLPDGYGLYGESYLDLEQLYESYADIFDQGELEDLGIVGYYETTYLSADDGSQIRSYVIEYPDVAAAEDGFGLLEDEDTVVTIDADLEDAPGAEGIGEEPAEITTGTIGEGDTAQATVDVTFRIDRLAVGVAIETFDGTEPDEDVAVLLAAEAEARVVAALTGDDIADIDPSLVERVVTLDGSPTFEGYQTVVDGYGFPDSLAAEGFVSSYVRGSTFSDDTFETIAPYITVGVSSYDDEDAVLAVLDATDQIMPSFDELEEIDVPLVDRLPTVAYSFESLIQGGDIASVRLFVALDDTLLSIDAQGFATTDDALAAATEIAEAAASCADGGDCGPVGLPDDLGGSSDAPDASPEADDDSDTL